MKRLTLICVILFLFYSFAFSGVITRQLSEKMEEIGNNELIPVNVIMKEQADMVYLMNLVKGKEVTERREIVINYLKKIRDISQKRILLYLESMEEEGKVEQVRSLWLGNAVCFEAHNDVIEEIAKLPDIRSIDLDEERELIVRPEKLTPTLPVGRDIVWNINLVRAPEVWALGYTGENIIVSVLDTGVRYTHRDLKDHIWKNTGEIPGNGLDDDSNGYVDDYYGYDFYNDDGDPIDDNGHGTHCAGTVAGDGTCGTQTGVAPGAQVMSLKVLNNYGGGNESDVWEAMQYSIDNGAHVISMSLGWCHNWNPDRQQWRNTCNAVLAGGIIMSVAAGNEGGSPSNPIPDNVRTPGDVPPPWLHPDQTLIGGLSAVVTVGATDSLDSIADFSSRGPVTWDTIPPWNDYPYNPEMGLIDPDISAPGVCITSLDYSTDDGYVGGPMWSGTSMATPHVAGAMALMLSKNSGLAQAIMDSILEVTSVDYGLTGKDTDYGAGRLDCYEAFTATPVGVGESKKTVYPKVFGLSRNAPNPFYNGTFITYQIPDGRSVYTVLSIYDVSGKLIKTLVNSQHDPGKHSVYWDGRDGLGRRVVSGIYFVRFAAGGYVRTGKMLLLR
ncbi:S8 family serine peptidase [candidate division WOR-3 bacterium]|nr:S8 family serine peptidase [candidate division WOR-3 bacterium]